MEEPMRALREEALALGSFRAEVIRVSGSPRTLPSAACALPTPAAIIGKIICARRISAAQKS